MAHKRDIKVDFKSLEGRRQLLHKGHKVPLGKLFGAEPFILWDTYPTKERARMRGKIGKETEWWSTFKVVPGPESLRGWHLLYIPDKEFQRIKRRMK